jgi:aryl-alcohol dehydrogenase-like predicted oxidoreductase
MTLTSRQPELSTRLPRLLMTPGQIALAGLLNKGDDIVPIPGTKRRKFLEENGAAANLQLNPDQMKTLDDAIAPGKNLRQALRRLDIGLWPPPLFATF